jgi:hypothetical protein
MGGSWRNSANGHGMCPAARVLAPFLELLQLLELLELLLFIGHGLFFWFGW